MTMDDSDAAASAAIPVGGWLHGQAAACAVDEPSFPLPKGNAEQR